MDINIIKKLVENTEEEKAILSGDKDIKKFYTVTQNFVIKGNSFFKDKQINIKVHPRYVDFPNHGHDYLEIMYVYSGKITHVINNEKVTLKSGDIIILNRHVRHSILKADKDDVGINIIIGNDFLKMVLERIGNGLLSSFLVENSQNVSVGKYLNFNTENVFPIKNLMDNIIYELATQKNQDLNILSQLILLLFCYLDSYNNLLVNDYVNGENYPLKKAIDEYVNNNFANASLNELAKKENYSVAYLSRLTNKLFNKKFKDLVIEKRIQIAQKLLLTTDMKIYEISQFVGYENLSHFYQLFFTTTNTTPDKFRLANK